jgi:hypothetical protein
MALRRLLRQVEPLPERERRLSLVHRIEVQAGCARDQELLTQVVDDLETEATDRIAIVAVALEATTDPARDLGPAGV